MGAQLGRQAVMKKSFGKYVGPEVLDMIMDDPEKIWLKGRKDIATILFTDIRGFTAYSENREPEKLVEKLNEYFEIATRIISRHGGYTDKFIGDGVLGVFGVPVFHQDHCERCLMAALEMQAEFAKRSESNSGNPLLKRVGIGINSGVVIAGNIGSPAKMEYTVIGNSVNFASRLSDLAKAGEILIDESMLKGLGNKIDYIKLASRVIKGKTDPIDIYKVTGFRMN
jgi:adenylate cyclase